MIRGMREIFGAVNSSQHERCSQATVVASLEQFIYDIWLGLRAWRVGTRQNAVKVRQMARIVRLGKIPATPTRIRLGERLRARRLELGMSQASVYEASGVAASYVSAIENAEVNISFDVLERICEALKVELYELIKP